MLKFPLPRSLKAPAQFLRERWTWNSALVEWKRLRATRAESDHDDSGPLKSTVCTARQLHTPAFRNQLAKMKCEFQLQRKYWEWAFIAQALQERGCLASGKKGLGFAVGTEPLSAYFASTGCEILATDLPSEDAIDHRSVWLRTGQHSSSRDSLNTRGICEETVFHERVRFCALDMSKIPSQVTGFDFLWSACALEHLGTLDAGIRFIEESLKCLKPGGVAVHTTEFNVLSDTKTIEVGPDVVYRKRDIEALARRLAAKGHHLVERDYSLGNMVPDWQVDRFPYRASTHLKLHFRGHVVTSFGLIIHKASR